ncbi:MAG: roadblock/LC7 domain-containing protein [Nanoarchaeota archaeon]
MVKISEKKEIKEILMGLRHRISDIEGCSVVSRDGLVVASELMAEVESKAFAALSADVTKSGEVVSSELRIGGLGQIIINSSKGNIITANVGKKAILVCLVKPKANVGLVLLHMDRTSQRLLRYIK